MKIKLSALAQQFELKLDGNGNDSITGVSSLDKAGQEQLSFLANINIHHN